jgi:ATP phosphoribosyltransferase regulatory subunit HisZ
LRPQYFGKLTNDIVYRRLAPGVLAALKAEGVKAEKKGKLHQHLTAGYGRQELLKHLGSVDALMRLSKTWPDFMDKLNQISPRFGDSYALELEETDR